MDANNTSLSFINNNMDNLNSPFYTIYRDVVNFVYYLILIPLGFFGNLFTVIIVTYIIRHQQTRRSIPDICLGLLASVDLFSVLFIHSISATAESKNAVDLPLGICEYQAFVSSLYLKLQFLLQILICLDRHFALVRPLQYRKFSSLKTMKIMFLLIALVGIGSTAITYATSFRDVEVLHLWALCRFSWEFDGLAEYLVVGATMFVICLGLLTFLVCNITLVTILWQYHKQKTELVLKEISKAVTDMKEGRKSMNFYNANENNNTPVCDVNNVLKGKETKLIPNQVKSHSLSTQDDMNLIKGEGENNSTGNKIPNNNFTSDKVIVNPPPSINVSSFQSGDEERKSCVLFVDTNEFQVVVNGKPVSISPGNPEPQQSLNSKSIELEKSLSSQQCNGLNNTEHKQHRLSNGGPESKLSTENTSIIGRNGSSNSNKVFQSVVDDEDDSVFLPTDGAVSNVFLLCDKLKPSTKNNCCNDKSTTLAKSVNTSINSESGAKTTDDICMKACIDVHSVGGDNDCDDDETTLEKTNETMLSNASHDELLNTEIAVKTAQAYQSKGETASQKGDMVNLNIDECPQSLTFPFSQSKGADKFKGNSSPGMNCYIASKPSLKDESGNVASEDKCYASIKDQNESFVEDMGIKCDKQQRISSSERSGCDNEYGQDMNNSNSAPYNTRICGVSQTPVDPLSIVINHVDSSPNITTMFSPRESPAKSPLSLGGEISQTKYSLCPKGDISPRKSSLKTLDSGSRKSSLKTLNSDGSRKSSLSFKEPYDSSRKSSLNPTEYGSRKSSTQSKMETDSKRSSLNPNNPQVSLSISRYSSPQSNNGLFMGSGDNPGSRICSTTPEIVVDPPSGASSTLPNFSMENNYNSTTINHNMTSVPPGNARYLRQKSQESSTLDHFHSQVKKVLKKIHKTAYKQQGEIFLARIVLLCATLFLLSWVPYVVVTTLYMFDYVVNPILEDLATRCIFANAVFNPIFYGICRKNYRKGYNYITQAFCHIATFGCIDAPGEDKVFFESRKCKQKRHLEAMEYMKHERKRRKSSAAPAMQILQQTMILRSRSLRPSDTGPMLSRSHSQAASTPGDFYPSRHLQELFQRYMDESESDDLESEDESSPIDYEALVCDDDQMYQNLRKVLSVYMGLDEMSDDITCGNDDMHENTDIDYSAFLDDTERTDQRHLLSSSDIHTARSDSCIEEESSTNFRRSCHLKLHPCDFIRQSSCPGETSKAQETFL